MVINWCLEREREREEADKGKVWTQVTIVVLLKRGPEQVQVGSEYYSYDKSGIGESVGWLEKRMHFLREEMIMVEDRLQRMRQDHAALKSQLHQLERLLLRHQQ